MPDALYEPHPDGYAIITLNRPERLNAESRGLFAGIREAIAQLTADPRMRVGILTGMGRAFCAGHDLKERAEDNAAGMPKPEVTAHHQTMYSDCPKPIIAAVNGLAVGGGVEQVLDCDIRIASSKATFAMVEGRVGLMAGYAVHHLPRQVPLVHANYMLLTGDRISAQKALEWGLINEVVDPERLLPRAAEIAQMIIEGAPLSVEGTKAVVRRWRMQGVEDSFRLSRWVYRANIDLSEDAREGPRAFAEKRKPVWRGA